MTTSSSAQVYATAISRNQGNGRAIVFRYIHDFGPGFDRATLPDRVILVWKYQSAGGMPAVEERQRMDALEPTIFFPSSDRVPRLLFQTRDSMAIAKVTDAVRRIDADARVEIAPLRDRLDAWLGEIALAPVAASVLGVFGLIVATVGMLGVFSYAVR